jgi:hypothetical protein
MVAYFCPNCLAGIDQKYYLSMLSCMLVKIIPAKCSVLNRTHVYQLFHKGKAALLCFLAI